MRSKTLSAQHSQTWSAGNSFKGELRLDCINQVSMLLGQKGGSLRAMAASRLAAERKAGTFLASSKTAGSPGMVLTCAIKIQSAIL